MTEHEWAVCSAPKEMLDHVFASWKPSARELRLLACGFCRGGVWPHLDDVGKDLVELAEGYADGLPRKEELQEAVSSAPWTGGLPTVTAAWSAVADIRGGVQRVLDLGLQVAAGTPHQIYVPELARSEIEFQCSVLRDVFLPPFPKLPQADAFLRWNGGTLSRLAHSIYTQRRFDLMPIVADGLEEAGCEDERVLAHCRETRIHFRGCWVIDWLLGRRWHVPEGSEGRGSR